MTTKILQLDSSLFSENGVSSQLNQVLVQRLARAHEAVEVIHRDLAKNAIPYFSADVLAALSAPPEERTPAQVDVVQLADTLIAELVTANVIVVAAPMYNFGIPAALKTWIDYVARAGVTFRYTASGSEGLVDDKPVYLVTTRGGLHKGQLSDVEVAYLTVFFNFLGLTDIRVIYAEGMNTRQRDENLVLAKVSIEQLVMPEEVL